MKRQIFYSFHFKNDFWRVNQIRNIGALEDNRPVSANEWEEVKRKGKENIEKWIDDNMKYRSCVVVLVGQETADREWVQFEIKKAWKEGRGLLGIYIHNLKDANGQRCIQGKNPFDKFYYGNRRLSSIVKCYNPNSFDAYNDIRNHLEEWVEEAIKIRDNN